MYLNSEKEHKEHIKWVLSRLYKENILVIVKKYKFHIKKTDFIRFIIKLRQISINLKKIKIIQDQQDPKSVISLKLFTFQENIQTILLQYIWIILIVYLDSEKEYKEYIKWVLSKLYKEDMPVAIKKYKFYIKKTNFIKFIIKLK